MLPDEGLSIGSLWLRVFSVNCMISLTVLGPHMVD